jgi:FkbM family methyltransferase
MSQFGADIWVLNRAPEPGFYLDVGCHDGVVNSNTFLLDKMGWEGICIDPFPRNFAKRTAKVIEAVVYSSDGTDIEFCYSVEDSGCSGIAHELSTHKERLFSSTTIQKHRFKSRTLESILAESGAPRRIDYLSMDIEGAELEALRVFPFSKWSFHMLTIEHNFEEPKRSQLKALLESQGYALERSVQVDDWYVNSRWSSAD